MADNKVNSGLLEFSENQKVFVALDAETSEVQKAVTIDGDGVETDIQGVQPSGKKEITSTAEVNVASYATAQVVDEDLVAGNIKKDVDILGVVGSYEAPASDFSTAEVTFNFTFQEVADDPMVTPEGTVPLNLTNDGLVNEATVQMETIPVGATSASLGVITLPLYKGKLKLDVSFMKFEDNFVTYVLEVSGSITASGNATINDRTATITGDCVITIPMMTERM